MARRSLRDWIIAAVVVMAMTAAMLVIFPQIGQMILMLVGCSTGRCI